jgi:hypothetical protein
MCGLLDAWVSIFVERVQWYFRKKYSENMYANIYKMERLSTLSLDDSWGIYNPWILLFLWNEGAEKSFYPLN